MELKRAKQILFRKDMVKYFDDGPELSEQIKNKEARKDDMELIVKYYNIKYGNE